MHDNYELFHCSEANKLLFDQIYSRIIRLESYLSISWLFDLYAKRSGIKNPTSMTRALWDLNGGVCAEVVDNPNLSEKDFRRNIAYWYSGRHSFLVKDDFEFKDAFEDSEYEEKNKNGRRNKLFTSKERLIAMILYMGVFDLSDCDDILTQFGFRPLYIFNYYEAIAKFVLQCYSVINGESKYNYFHALLEKFKPVVDSNAFSPKEAKCDIYTPNSEKIFKSIRDINGLEQFFNRYYGRTFNRVHMTVYEWYYSLTKQRINTFLNKFVKVIESYSNDGIEEFTGDINDYLLQYNQAKKNIGKLYIKKKYGVVNDANELIEKLSNDSKFPEFDYCQCMTLKKKSSLQKIYLYIGTMLIKVYDGQHYHLFEQYENDLKSTINLFSTFINIIINKNDLEFAQYNVDRNLVILCLIYEYLSQERIYNSVSLITDNKNAAKKLENDINNMLFNEFGYSELNGQFAMDHLLLSVLYNTDFHNLSDYPLAWGLDELQHKLIDKFNSSKKNVLKATEYIKDILAKDIDSFTFKMEKSI
ncbi:MAG: hypothetical protein IKJ07_08025 [Clostridia bacterium]|nr:hypothetical protein [Clostridia bacterium]